MKQIIFKYIGYFLAVASAIGVIYGIGVFFANIQSDIKQVVNTVSEIKTEQIDQSDKIKSIEYEVSSISDIQSKQESFNRVINKNYSDHLNKSKELIDEYTNYLKMQIEENEKKKDYMDSIMLPIKHNFKYEKIK